ncbi:MAG: nickel-responsive transcriptional regulator NikR [Patescibacteria group bacterium]|nr:nickel-responsive transcriptional regulator NikR [Patescibacteria group bacterium]
MERLDRFGVSMNSKLLESFDNLITKKGYSNRSEAIRDIVRDYIVDSEWSSLDDKEVVGTVTIVYNHHVHELSDELIDLQHHNHSSIISTLHVHLDEHNCLEIMILKGSVDDVRAIADKIISTKGVKHGKLVCTTTGKNLE